MRFRTLFLATAFLVGAHGFAQSGNFDGLNYQAVIRNTTGDPMPNQSVSLRIEVQAGLASGYVETHSVTSNSQGLVSLVIGQGTPTGEGQYAVFANIPWSNGDTWNYQAFVDLTGGTNYTSLGGGAFRSVPFALHALSSADNGWHLSSGILSNTNNGPVGIGTTAPSGPFETWKADGSFVVRSWSGSGEWVVVNDIVGRNNFLPQQRFSSENSGNWADIGLGAGQSFRIETNDVPRLVIQQDGNVGIGTSTPGSALQVGSFSGDPYITVAGAGDYLHRNGIKFRHFSDSYGHTLVSDDSLEGFNFLLHDADTYGPNGISRLFIQNYSGNVGIGTTDPSAKLHVTGALKVVDGTQGAGKVLTSDAAGLASWQPAAGSAAGTAGLVCNLYFSLGQAEPGLCSANRVTGVTVTSNMGACCGGTLGAMVDQSGLTVPNYLGLHNTDDGSGWKSNSTLSGYLIFDLQSVRDLQRFAVWNHGQLGGQRGVNNVTIETSVNGVAYVPLPNGPTQFAMATVSPVTPQKFVLAAPVAARYIRFNITSGWGAVNTGLGEVMFWAD